MSDISDKKNMTLTRTYFYKIYTNKKSGFTLIDYLLTRGDRCFCLDCAEMGLNIPRSLAGGKFRCPKKPGIAQMNLCHVKLW